MLVITKALLKLYETHSNSYFWNKFQSFVFEMWWELGQRCEGDVSFAIEVAVAKYLFHFPLERQVKAMKLDGLTITSQTLWDQIFALAMLLRPVYEKIHDYLLAQRYLHSNFTPGIWLEKGLKKDLDR